MTPLTLILFPLLVFGLSDLFLFTSTSFMGYTVEIGSFKLSLLNFATLGGLIAGVTTVLSIVVISGLGVFSSGLNTLSVETILKLGFLLLTFGVLCLPSAIIWFNMFGFFGQFFTLALTLSYIVGGILMVRGGG